MDDAQVMDLMYQAANNVGMPYIGTREEMDEVVTPQDVAFFREFAMLYAAAKPIA